MSALLRPICGRLDSVLSILTIITGCRGTGPDAGSPVSGHWPESTAREAVLCADGLELGLGGPWAPGLAAPPLQPARARLPARPSARNPLRRRDRCMGTSVTEGRS